MSRKYSKIRVDGDKAVELKWTTTDGTEHGTISHELESTDPPRTDFTRALAELRPTVATILELKPDYAGTIEPRSVALSYDSEDRLGVVISSVRDLERTNSPLVLHTPLVRLGKSDEDEPEEWKRTLYATVDRLMEQADSYIAGKRAQGDLFEDDPVERTAVVEEQPEPVPA